MKVCLSLARWPGSRHHDAIELLAQPHAEPVLRDLSIDDVQLVPQSHGLLDEALVERLQAAYPRTRFRLHANVRVTPNYVCADLSGFDRHRRWFERAATINHRLDAPAYSAHAGWRGEASVEQVFDQARRCADLFGCPVAVEGMYPASHADYLVSSWAEYRQLFESGVPYALDLSHLNIVAAQSGIRDDGLVREMLACERCLEVHVSDNDGTGDQHRICLSKPWWWQLLQYIHDDAVIFSEGNTRSRLPGAATQETSAV
ncbi:hypothetical protein [Burkholderia cepacia]|uniref:hypothetical protein n=1 Tax=Burkholderia cepacia TaxID=292 RepID=UPI001CF27FE0|nr:hypothetical protein [Burkholderia cepacia]MCA8355615.1 hypothetical protein [Burkholderia cepacia]